MKTNEWHQLASTTVVQQLGSDVSSGLSSTEAAQRLVEYGTNELSSADRISPWMIFLGQFRNVLIAILLVAILLSIFLGHGAYAGTAVTYGRGQGVVVATGMATEFGKTAAMLETVASTKTPLQDNLDKVGNALARASLFIVAVIVGVGLYRGQPFVEMIIFGIALAVAAVPEALPAVVTISLALGVQRMAKRNALVRRLPAVETLGSTSVICSDKTGTLTKDEMTARQIYVAQKLFEVSGAGFEPRGEFMRAGLVVEPCAALKSLLRAAVLTSDARLAQRDGRWEVKGDPTEGALIVLAAKAGLKKMDLETECPRVHEIPFSSEAKRMTTSKREQDGCQPKIPATSSRRWHCPCHSAEFAAQQITLHDWPVTSVF